MASGHIFMEGFGEGTRGRTHYLRQNWLETSSLISTQPSGSGGILGTQIGGTDSIHKAYVFGLMGLSENSVPLHPMVNDHCPY